MFNQILKASKFVVENSNDVKINYEKIQTLIDEIEDFIPKHYLLFNDDIMSLNTEDIINLLLILNSNNCCFWGDPKWTIELEGNEYDGGEALLYATLNIFKTYKGKEVFNYLANITQDDFAKLLKGNVEIPLLEERYEVVTNVAKVVIKEMNGNFYEYIKDFSSDGELFKLIIDKFPSSKDVRLYKGQEIPLYKLAQLLTSDILHILEYKDKKNVDYSNLIGCSDYKIPQILRSYGILEYSDDLANIVDNKIEIEENNPFEVEIRASMLVVIDYIYNAINGSVCKMDINDYIWLKGKNKSLIHKPYHLTRTLSY